MSAGLILLFLREDAIESWARLHDGAVVERGGRGEPFPTPVSPATGDPVRVAAVVPGEEVTLHWVELPPDLAPPQAAAAARLMAGELSAQPASDVHVAVGPEADEGEPRCIAIVASAKMSAWIGACQAIGLDPDIVIPEPLIILPEKDKLLSREWGALSLYRAPTDAFAMEPALAATILAGADPVPVEPERFERELAQAVERRPVDLRQGAFARRKRWKIDMKLARRLALLAAALLIATFAVQIASILRHTFAADRLEAERVVVAAEALPGGSGGADAPRQLERRLAELRGGGTSFSALASAFFASVQATPNAEVVALAFDRDALRATVIGDSPATISALRERAEASGLSAEAGPLRSSEGRQMAEFTVRAR